jgi:pyruvate,orthophosphate dikinase
MEATLDFWMTRQKEEVEPFVPPNIYGEIETEGPYVEGVHRVMTRLVQDQDLGGIKDLLQIETHDLRTLIGEVPGASDPDFERIDLAVSLYKLLYQKYDMGFVEMEGYLSRLQSAGFQDLDRLRDALSETDVPQKLSKLLAYLEELKAVVLSPRAYEIREDIYRKRHFTVDIPSMYGSYHERKFDALGLTFRLESVANVLFEELTHTIDLNLITRATFSQIHHYLRLFDRALKLDGITSLEMERQLDLFAHSLEIRGFSSTQYLDIFRGFSQAVSNIVNDFFDNIHQDNLFKILHQMPKGTLLPKYGVAGIEVDPDRLPHRVAEIFLRDRIATSLGLQQLDIFLARILNTLNQQADELPGERQHQLLSYDPQKALTPISPAKQEVNDIIHLGNKGLNLVKMTGLGMPVPPGFIITTEAFRFRDIIDHYEPAKRNFQEHVALEIKALEAATGRSLGDPRNPLLLSTRSGSSISQPGMMSTFLDVGINEEIVQGLIALTGNEWFGWDTYRRFLQSYGMAFGLIRDDFDAIINQFKERLGHLFKKDFSGEQMKEVALAYKSFISEAGIDIQESPFQQLLVAIQKVFESWFASKAQAYRKIMGISDEWGTAVTVQSMVFGNFSPSSGAGVFFTHSPRWKGDMLIPWGDFTLGNQGEDVVSGLVRTLPISGRQAEMENRARDTTLESLFPEIYQSLRQWAKALIYDRKWSPQEMEFTFEGARQKDLYFLQTRDMSMRQRKTVYSFDMTSRASHEFLGHGIGVSGGAMTGRVVFSLEEIRQWRKAEPHTSLILVRGDTVPDDIMEIYEADGLLTARGGSTSHAAIVAHRLDKTCVVGFPNLLCMEKDRTCSLSQRVLKTGDRISMDGRDGAVFLGAMQVKEVESG